MYYCYWVKTKWKKEENNRETQAEQAEVKWQQLCSLYVLYYVSGQWQDMCVYDINDIIYLSSLHSCIKNILCKQFGKLKTLSIILLLMLNDIQATLREGVTCEAFNRMKIFDRENEWEQTGVSKQNNFLCVTLTNISSYRGNSICVWGSKRGNLCLILLLLFGILFWYIMFLIGNSGKYYEYLTREILLAIVTLKWQWWHVVK